MIAALIVGALTAWFLGLRLGIIAAVATAVLLLVAMFVPGMSIGIYLLVAAYCAALYFFGKKLQVVTGQKGLIGGPAASAMSFVGQAQSWIKAKLGGDVNKNKNGKSGAN